jgi:hypothetical protein
MIGKKSCRVTHPKDYWAGAATAIGLFIVAIIVGVCAGFLSPMVVTACEVPSNRVTTVQHPPNLVKFP